VFGFFHGNDWGGCISFTVRGAMWVPDRRSSGLANCTCCASGHRSEDKNYRLVEANPGSSVGVPDEIPRAFERLDEAICSNNQNLLGVIYV